ncbi:hypothetical protein EVAR_9769_1 [Eumeta japonica]|uniref:Uncharacterized protein n=1 Tax=Eumeta variegata TaxID=151549 RepID=A0A4C1U6K0_EUMVA|nr:hypothetical protein EVAR_9769_1 [Eumeta japonica]
MKSHLEPLRFDSLVNLVTEVTHFKMKNVPEGLFQKSLQIMSPVFVKCQNMPIDAPAMRSTGLDSFIGEQIVTASWRAQYRLTEVLQTLRIRGLTPHHDNLFSYAAALTVNFLKENNIIVLEMRLCRRIS